MSSTQPGLIQVISSESFILSPASFLLARSWRSISGSNSAALGESGKYNTVSQELQTIPFRLIVEWGAIFLPMLFHGGYGIYIWCGGNRMSRRIRGWEIGFM